MIFTGKSMRSAKRIISLARSSGKIRLAKSTDNLPSTAWEQIGFPTNIAEGQYLIPASIGKVTAFNVHGEDVPQKHLPMETVSHMIWKTWKDWHGYSHSGFVDQDYKRYPRKHIAAPAENFCIFTIDNTPTICSRELDVSTESESSIRHIANMFLECFGEFYILSDVSKLPIGTKLLRLQWEVLPKGKYPWSAARPLVLKYTSTLDESAKMVIERRIEHITRFNPDFMAIGRGGFHGYFVYGFDKLQIFLLESLHIGNATYVFGEKWEDLSKLTKSEIINGKHPHRRIIHDSNWHSVVRKMLG